MKKRKLKWVVEFSVDRVWVEDGFDLTQERALDMLAHDLTFAYIDDELEAKIIKAPDPKEIRKIQGYKD